MAKTFPDPQILPKEIQHEARTLRDNQDEIMKHVGEYVLIQGASVVGYFPTYGEAATEGYERFSLDNFLVRPVRLNETPVRAMRCGVVKSDGKLRLTRAKAR